MPKGKTPTNKGNSAHIPAQKACKRGWFAGIRDQLSGSKNLGIILDNVSCGVITVGMFYRYNIQIVAGKSYKLEVRMTDEKKRPGPRYYGMTKHWDQQAGYAVWLPSDWRKIDMVEGRRGWIFTPYQDNFDTCFTSEKITLDYKATPKDAEILMEGFEAGINSLPEVLVEYKNCDVGKMVVILEAKFTFTENGQRRKRWVKNMYWGEANLILMAQGATEEDYAYWEGMLFNSMTTYEIT